MEIDNLKDFSNISYKLLKQNKLFDLCQYLVNENESKQKRSLEKINGEMDERLPSLFRYVENFFVACKQSQGNKQEQSKRKNMA